MWIHLVFLVLVRSEGDLISHTIRNAWRSWDEKMTPNQPIDTLVTAAQGKFEGPEVLYGIRRSDFTNEAHFPALTGINLATGVIILGNDNQGGCGIIPFHGHPNCYEVMTTISGMGGYGQVRPDGTIQRSRVMRPGERWVMEHSAQHYYRNLDPNSEWKFEISFDCSEVGSVSSWKWIGALDKQLVKAFWPGVNDAAAQDLSMEPDSRVTKSSTRYIANCADDLALHQAVTGDGDLFLDAPTSTQANPGTGGTLNFFTYRTPGTPTGVTPTRIPHTAGEMTIEVGNMMNPSVVYNAHTVYHLIQGEVMIAVWSWDNQISVEVLNVHDLMLVPRGAVHFIINKGSTRAIIYPHYDIPGTAANQIEWEPRTAVVSNFFSSEKPTLIEAVLRCETSAAEALSAAASDHVMFEPFNGNMDTLVGWMESKPDYCPMGCPHNDPEATETTEEATNVYVSFTDDRADEGGNGGLWAVVIISFILNLFFVILMFYIVKHVDFDVSTIWDDCKRKLNWGDDDDSQTQRKYDAPVHSYDREDPPVRGNFTKQSSGNSSKNSNSSFGMPPQTRSLERKKSVAPKIPDSKFMPAAPVPPMKQAARNPPVPPHYFPPENQDSMFEETHWYYECNGDTVGPITESALRDAHRLKKINGQTLVWSEVFGDDWTSLNDCPHINWASSPI